MLIALNKPYGVLCQFSPSGARATLKDFVPTAGVYPAGRLDLDSEGLVLLTDDGSLQQAIAAPASKLAKYYWVQVEREPDAAALARLTAGVQLGDYESRCVVAQRIATPRTLWPRDPPIRVRQNIPTAWLEIALLEGKNRQVRRTTAAVGHPTLRLIRSAIGPISVTELGLAPGQSVQIDPSALQLSNPVAAPRKRNAVFHESGQPARRSRR